MLEEERKPGLLKKCKKCVVAPDWERKTNVIDLANELRMDPCKDSHLQRDQDV